MTPTVYSIGHSIHPIEEFIRLLKMHGITAIYDVRSAPYSRMNPQFNRESLHDELFKHGIQYQFLGKELGARPNDQSCYRNGKAQYELISKSTLFKKGLDRLKNDSVKYRIALMCAEKDPLQCHRAILVGRNLATEGISVQHILSNGAIETQEVSVQRLLSFLNMSPLDLYRSEDEVIQDAYRIQGDSIAYSGQNRNERSKG